MYCSSKGKVKYYETGWIVLELVLDRHSVEKYERTLQLGLSDPCWW